jgi:hypothetical protein
MPAYRIPRAAMVITAAVWAIAGAGALTGASYPASAASVSRHPSGRQGQATVQLTAFSVPGPGITNSPPNCPIPNPG